MFWQQFKTRLEQQIDLDTSRQAGHWPVQLDDPPLLRYVLAGLRLPGRLRLHREAVRVMTWVEVMPSSWQEQFEAQLAVRKNNLTSCQILE